LAPFTPSPTCNRRSPAPGSSRSTPPSSKEKEQLGVTELFEQYLAEKGTRQADAELVRTLFRELEASDFEEEHPAARIGSVEGLLRAPLPDPPPQETQPEPPETEPIKGALA
jgi:hypothetical protein